MSTPLPALPTFSAVAADPGVQVCETRRERLQRAKAENAAARDAARHAFHTAAAAASAKTPDQLAVDRLLSGADSADTPTAMMEDVEVAARRKTFDQLDAEARIIDGALTRNEIDLNAARGKAQHAHVKAHADTYAAAARAAALAQLDGWAALADLMDHLDDARQAGHSPTTVTQVMKFWPAAVVGERFEKVDHLVYDWLQNGTITTADLETRDMLRYFPRAAKRGPNKETKTK